MPHHLYLRIIHPQSHQQLKQSIFLLGGTGITRPSSDVETTLVADADGVAVIPRGVCPHRIEGAAGMNHTIASDVVVIADVGKATGTMVTTAVVHGVTLRGAGGTTMNHYQVDATVVLVLRTMQYSVSHVIEYRPATRR